MTILIIGSKGFIGSHALNYFKAKNYIVFACDVVFDYTSENYYLIDATNANFQEIFERQQYDVCINCSGAASVPESIIYPNRDFELNVANVYKILDAIRKYQNSCKFINISSAAVYGNPMDLPIKENAPVQPVSPYGNHKLMAESILKEFHTYFGIPSISLRLFSVFGPGLRKQLFWDLYNKMQVASDSISLIGTGKESRDYIYIADVTQALDIIISNCDFNGEAINVANGIETSICEAVETFATAYGWKGGIHFTQKQRQGDPLNWRADITLLKKFGYIQKYSLEDGLKAYTQWLKEKI